MTATAPELANNPRFNPALALADCWQRAFPIEPEPFARLASPAELSRLEVIDLMQGLKDQGVLARIGAAVRPNTAGASTLAAIAVPPDRLEEVASLVSRHPAINHNYERDHAINLWFVVTAAARDDVTTTLDAIARQTGLEVLDLPLQRSYHIDLGFRLNEGRKRYQQPGSPEHRNLRAAEVDSADRALLKALEEGLDLTPRPYARLASRLGWTEEAVLKRLRALVDRGTISRFGCILRHRRIGYVANAMAVWDVPDDRVDALAHQLAGRDEVTLCYRRRRSPPAWRYNLFAMIHGRNHEAVTNQIRDAATDTGLCNYPSSILFSKRCYKQSGARIAPQSGTVT